MAMHTRCTLTCGTNTTNSTTSNNIHYRTSHWCNDRTMKVVAPSQAISYSNPTINSHHLQRRVVRTFHPFYIWNRHEWCSCTILRTCQGVPYKPCSVRSQVFRVNKIPVLQQCNRPPLIALMNGFECELRVCMLRNREVTGTFVVWWTRWPAHRSTCTGCMHFGNRWKCNNSSEFMCVL